MEAKSDYQAKIQNIAKMLPEEKLGEVLDFMEFLYRKEREFNKGISPAKAVFRSRDIDIYCSKKLPLLTRNKRHFSYIQEIRLSPVYDQR